MIGDLAGRSDIYKKEMQLYLVFTQTAPMICDLPKRINVVFPKD